MVWNLLTLIESCIINNKQLQYMHIHSQSGFCHCNCMTQDTTRIFCRFVQLTVQSFSHSLMSVFVYTLYKKSFIYKMSI